MSEFGNDAYVQLASLSVYVATIVWGGLAFVDIRRSHQARSVKYIAAGLTTLSIMTATMFVIAQIPWILEQQWRVSSVADTLAWLLHDWLNGLSHLALVLAVRAFVRWDPPALCLTHGVCPPGALARFHDERDQKLTGLTRDIAKLQARIDHLLEDMERD